MATRLDTLNRALAQGEEEAEINLTPMLDVVFIMLIFFIVTASFLKEVGVEATKPPSVQQQQQEKSESITVRIRSNNDIIIDGRSIDPRAVSAYITRKRAENPDAPIAILAGKLAKAEIVVGVVDSAREAGFRYDVIPITELPE